MDIRQVAKLAHLEITDAEVEMYTPQMADIVKYIEQLSEIDVLLSVADELGVNPTAGIRIKLASTGFGRWKESGGEKSRAVLQKKNPPVAGWPGQVVTSSDTVVVQAEENEPPTGPPFGSKTSADVRSMSVASSDSVTSRDRMRPE